MNCNCYRAEKNYLGKIGICIGTKECESCSCGGDEAKCDFYDYVRERAKKPVTNGDRIRSMTDEELARQINLNRQISCEQCHAREPECDEPLQDEYAVGPIDKWCERCLLVWLRQEVNDEARL